MAGQENTQPRPLSIIIESSADLDSLQEPPSNILGRSTETLSNGITDGSRRNRRIAVAPLQHPVTDIARSLKLEMVFGYNSGLKDFTDSSVDNVICAWNENDKSDMCDCDNHSETVSSENLQTSQYNEFSTSTTVSLDRTLCNISLANPSSKGTNMTDYKEIPIRSLNVSSNEVRRSFIRDIASGWHAHERRSHSETLNRELNEMTKQREQQIGYHLKGTTGIINTVRNEERNEIHDKELVVDNKESTIFDKGYTDEEHENWKNRIREGKPFSHFSCSSRPLRRSVGSFDFQESSVTPSTSIPYSKHQLIGKTGTASRFFLPSDSEIYQSGDKEYFRTAPGVKNEHVESKPLITVRSLPTFRKYSWNDHLREHHNEYAILRSLSDMAKCSSKRLTTKNNATHVNNKDNIERWSDTKLHTAANSNLPVTDKKPTRPTIHRISTIDQSDFNLLKDTAARLKLPVRKLSTMRWKEQYFHNENLKNFPNNQESNECDTQENGSILVTQQQKYRINELFSCLRQELIDIRLLDQELARQFLSIRHEMNKLRLNVQFQGHMEFLDGAEEDMEEVRELSRLVDIPPELLTSQALLQHIGVTKMNLTSRRFSTC